MKIFDTTPKPGSPVRLKMFFTAMLRMAKAWEKLSVYNGNVNWSNGIPTIVMDETADATFPWSLCAFGWKINPDGDNLAEVSISTGYYHGVAVGTTKLVISGTQTVYVDIDPTAGTGSILAGSLNSVTTGHLGLALYQFTEAGGTVGNAPTWINNIGGFYGNGGYHQSLVVSTPSGTATLNFKYGLLMTVT